MNEDLIAERGRRRGTAVDLAAADQLDGLDVAYAVESATRDLAVAAGDRVIGYRTG